MPFTGLGARAQRKNKSGTQGKALKARGQTLKIKKTLKTLKTLETL